MYIKLDQSMNLSITVNDTLYRGDNLSKKITYLIPKKVGEIDILAATLFLTYIRPDGIADIEILERCEDEYNETYYQYKLPVTSKITMFPGEICSWIQIYAGSHHNPIVAKTGECMLQIQSSKDTGDYVGDQQLKAIYQIVNTLNEHQEKIDAVSDELATKADGLVYNAEDESLSLTSDGNAIGDPVDMSPMVNRDEVIDFGNEESTDDSVDAVIYF